jgi:hypothetical protein
MSREPVEVGSRHKGAPGHVTTNPSSSRYGEIRADRASCKDNAPVQGAGGAAELERTLDRGMARGDRR